MKRIFLLTALSIIYTFSYPQDMASATAIGPSFEQLKKNKEKSDVAIQDEKTKGAPKTWFARGEMFQDIYESDIKGVYKGMDAMQAKIIIGNPKEIVKKGQDEVYVYPRLKLTFTNSIVSKWQKTETIVDQPLKDSYESYLKVIELDKELKFEKKLKNQFITLIQELKADALNEYANQNLEKALTSIETIVKIYDLGKDIQVDTLNIYLAGLIANENKAYDKAAQYLENVLDKKYYNEGEVHNELGKVYAAKGDTAQAINIMRDGFKLYPSNRGLLLEMINLYLKSNKDPNEILGYMAVAKEQDPGNPSLYLVEGTLYERLQNIDKAIECYKKSIEVDPKYFDAYYNLGVLIYNNGVALMKIADNEKDMKKYDIAKKAADDKFKESIEPFEKAFEINSKDKAVLETLKSLYFRLQMNDKYQEAKTKLESM